MTAPIIWLASYPRSGNTFLRTIIFQCFGVRSASIYPFDFEARTTVEALAGHIEHNKRGGINFGAEPVRFIKTHAAPVDDTKAIYIVRDGRAATTSLYDFYNRQVPLRDIIEGRHLFSTWATHLELWHPRTRPNTLLLRYEDLVNDLDSCVEQVARHTGLEPKVRHVPSREELASKDGHWIRPADAPRAPLKGQDLALFLKINRRLMKEYGYL